MIEFLINILQFVGMIIGCFIYIIVLASPGLNRYGAYNHCKTTDIKLPPPTPLPNNNKNKCNAPTVVPDDYDIKTIE